MAEGLPKFSTRVCRTHGRTEFVLEGRGYYRCKKCRQQRVLAGSAALQREQHAAILDPQPSDWTDMELDLRVEEERYIDAATIVAQVNAQPYSHHDWHWRLLVAHQFGHAAAAPAVSIFQAACSVISRAACICAAESAIQFCTVCLSASSEPCE